PSQSGLTHPLRRPLPSCGTGPCLCFRLTYSARCPLSGVSKSGIRGVNFGGGVKVSVVPKCIGLLPTPRSFPEPSEYKAIIIIVIPKFKSCTVDGANNPDNRRITFLGKGGEA